MRAIVVRIAIPARTVPLSVPEIFERVLLEGDLILIEETLSKAKQLLLPKYKEMKSRVLAFVEKELEKDDDEIHRDYVIRLENMKSRVLDLTEVQ